ncbi:hypothetical protein PR048_025998 [Dryococelus australis]|uniref:Uncharacterized protein n=1 Tax=Dryococelus australis TaxID=614101 RepID=A0ABQ9GK68_9NEOP|nr:hypothetical protein PR048_025998 [Dryococelus australis]
MKRSSAKLLFLLRAERPLISRTPAARASKMASPFGKPLADQRPLGSPLVDDRPIMNAVKYREVSGMVWTNITMVSSNAETNRTGVLAVVDIDRPAISFEGKLDVRHQYFIVPCPAEAQVARYALDTEEIRMLRRDVVAAPLMWVHPVSDWLGTEGHCSHRGEGLSASTRGGSSPLALSSLVTGARSRSAAAAPCAISDPECAEG